MGIHVALPRSAAGGHAMASVPDMVFGHLKSGSTTLTEMVSQTRGMATTQIWQVSSSVQVGLGVCTCF